MPKNKHEVPIEKDPEVLLWLLARLDKDELNEFLDGLRRFAGRGIDPDSALWEEWHRWWTSWIVSLRLDQDSEYGLEVKRSNHKVSQEDYGQAGGRQDIERLLAI